MATPPEIVGTKAESQLDAIRTPSLDPVLRPEFESTRFRQAHGRPAGQERSPSDTPAIRDIYTLQLAYPEVWDRMTDELFLDRVVGFYEERNQLEYGPDVEWPPGGPPGEEQSVEDIDNELRRLGDAAVEPLTPPDRVLIVFPEVTTRLWGWIGPGERQRILEVANLRLANIWSGNYPAAQVEAMRAEILGRKAEMERRGGRTYSWDRVVQAIKEIQQGLVSNYTFDVFHPGSYNYGLLATYRQEWNPGPYQTGDLVATIPLTPGESRKFSATRVINKTREQKTAEESVTHRQTESSKMSRAEAEISRLASFKMSLKYTNESLTGTAEGPHSSNTTEISGETAQESRRVKKSAWEATLKAAAEYKTQNRIEVTTSSSERLEESTSGEIRNPNNEITVTYLFYELQRQYFVEQWLHGVQPVILVAQEVPAPSEVDEDFLITNAWILRRVLLDDRFQAGLDYLRGDFVADEQKVALKDYQFSVESRLLGTLQAEMATLLHQRTEIREKVRGAMANQAESQGIFEDIGEGLLGFGPDDAEREQARLQAAERSLEMLESDIVEATTELERARESFRRTTDELAEALRLQATRRMAINELRSHVKQNIIYYMQAIWRSEVPDQRYYRLYDMEVEVPLPPNARVRVSPDRSGRADDLITYGGKPKPEPRRRLTLPGGLGDDDAPEVQFQTRRLREVADLTSPLGFHGNYAIFPLRQSNFVTTFLALSYLGDEFQVWDPDEESNYNVDELIARARQLKATNPQLARQDWGPIREKLREKLSNDMPNVQTIVVPWHHLFVEALPGKHPLLEDFKLEHRRIDVEKAKAEVRAAELDNIRRASRILGGENEDPDIDKKIVIEGTGVVPIVPANGDA